VSRALWVALGFAATVAGREPQLPGLTLAERGTVFRFLGCTDCARGELDSVRALALRKPEATVDTLARVLLAGVEVAVLDSLSTFLGREYDRLATSRRKRAAFVAFYREGFDVGHRRNAALALGWINTLRSDAVLRRAHAMPLHPRLRAVIDFALTHLPAP